jgi:hypothetical protein
MSWCFLVRDKRAGEENTYVGNSGWWWMLRTDQAILAGHCFRTLERVSGFYLCNVSMSEQVSKPSCLSSTNQALLFEACEGRVAVSPMQAAIAGRTDRMTSATSNQRIPKRKTVSTASGLPI